MWLELNDLAVDCVIGDLPDERTRDQRLLVTLRAEISDAAASSDALADTVDYVKLASAVRTTLVSARCRLIERAVRLVAETALAETCVRSVRVRIVKSGTVPGLGSAAVTYEERRHD